MDSVSSLTCSFGTPLGDQFVNERRSALHLLVEVPLGTPDTLAARAQAKTATLQLYDDIVSDAKAEFLAKSGGDDDPAHLRNFDSFTVRSHKGIVYHRLSFVHANCAAGDGKRLAHSRAARRPLQTLGKFRMAFAPPARIP